MRPFLVEKRKMLELGLLACLGLIILYFWGNSEAVILFSLGYVWNWTASQDLSIFFENKKYRFSLLKMVFNLQYLFLIPFKRLPRIIQILPKILPAGTFWLLIVLFIGSDMPWWTTFIGSLVFELTQVEKYFIKREEDSVQ